MKIGVEVSDIEAKLRTDELGCKLTRIHKPNKFFTRHVQKAGRIVDRKQ